MFTNNNYVGLSKERYCETLEVSKILGPIKIWFFDYPDRGIAEKNETIYASISKPCLSREGKTSTYKQVDDGLDNYFPDRFSKKPLPYIKSFLKTFIEFLKGEKPDVIISTSWDSNPGHRMVCSILSEAI